MTYYIVTEQFVGPEDPNKVNEISYMITTEAPRTNMSKEVLLNGWLGTTNGWSHHSYGSYVTEREAIAVIAALIKSHGYDGFRDAEINDWDRNSGIIAAFHPGKYEPLSRQVTGDLAFEWMQTEILPSATDEEIEVIAFNANLELQQNEGCTYHPDLMEMLIEFRDELIKEGQDNA